MGPSLLFFDRIPLLLSRFGYTHCTTMSINNTTSRSIHTYEEAFHIRRLLDEALVPHLTPLWRPSYQSARGEARLLKMSTEDARNQINELICRYNYPARPGEFIFGDILFHRKTREYVRIVEQRHTHVIADVREHVGDPNDPHHHTWTYESRFKIGDGYIEDPSPGSLINWVARIAVRLWEVVDNVRYYWNGPSRLEQGESTNNWNEHGSYCSYQDSNPGEQ